MFGFLKKLFGGDTQTNREAGVQIEQVPYKVETPEIVAVSAADLPIVTNKVSAVNSQPIDKAPQRAKNNKGKFVADNPATPENEAWVDGKAPAKKKPAAIKGTKKPAAKKAPARKKAAK
jgi:hypothetical protein